MGLKVAPLAGLVDQFGEGLGRPRDDVEDRRDSVGDFALQAVNDDDIRLADQHDGESGENEQNKGEAVPQSSQRPDHAVE